jgi:hypothetical protein
MDYPVDYPMNFLAIWGMIPLFKRKKPNEHDSRVRENSDVVFFYTNKCTLPT